MQIPTIREFSSVRGFGDILYTIRFPCISIHKCVTVSSINCFKSVKNKVKIPSDEQITSGAIANIHASSCPDIASSRGNFGCHFRLNNISIVGTTDTLSILIILDQV